MRKALVLPSVFFAFILVACSPGAPVTEASQETTPLPQEKTEISPTGSVAEDGILLETPQIETDTPIPTPSDTPVPTFTVEPTQVSPSPTPSPIPIPELNRVLSLQSPALQGEDVLALQEQLLVLGYSEVGTPDGIFGSLTDIAIKRFQTEHSLAVDGVVGPQTWQALFLAKT